MNYQAYQEEFVLGHPEYAYFPVTDYTSMLYGDCLSLSETLSIRTSDIHPVPDTSTVVQTIANAPFGSPTNQKETSQQPVMMWPTMPFAMNQMYMQEYAINEIDCNLSQSYSSEEDDNPYLPSSSMNKCGDTEDQFCHLSKKELIQRVIELEREKQLTSNFDLGQLDNDIRICCWAGCDTLTTSLNQLTMHIKDVHIGSGKPAYYCEWASCPREGKPFTKRHKMQNHMRTHTGERPFKCTVEECDKRFSRLDSLNTHIKTHSNIRPFACTAENCNKAYFHSRSLRKHAKSHGTPYYSPYNSTQQPYLTAQVFHHVPL